MSDVKREPDGKTKAVGAPRVAGQWASIAQLLLLVRLRARNRRDLAVDSLERAAQVIYVTCKNWFSPARRQADKQRAEAAEPGPSPSGSPNNKGTDAHRDH